MIPSLRCRLRISWRISWRSLASRLDSGSSIRQTGFSAMIARPRATRCCWPPDSWLGRRSSSAVIPSRSALRRKRSSRSALATRRTFKTEEDILRHRQVREQRIGLEHHGKIAARRGRVGHVAPADKDSPRRRALQPGNQAQGRGLAAAGRPEQNGEVAAGRLERNAIDSDGAPPNLADGLDRNLRQTALPARAGSLSRRHSKGPGRIWVPLRSTILLGNAAQDHKPGVGPPVRIVGRRVRLPKALLNGGTRADQTVGNRSSSALTGPKRRCPSIRFWALPRSTRRRSACRHRERRIPAGRSRRDRARGRRRCGPACSRARPRRSRHPRKRYWP